MLQLSTQKEKQCAIAPLLAPPREKERWRTWPVAYCIQYVFQLKTNILRIFFLLSSIFVGHPVGGTQGGNAWGGGDITRKPEGRKEESVGLRWQTNRVKICKILHNTPGDGPVSPGSLSDPDPSLTFHCLGSGY